jgi:16S rRNA (uracil1498-N3)-methyltransferase
MSLSRFFSPIQLAPHTRIALPPAQAHHALRVLRLRTGESIVLFDGSGGQYRATLEIDGKAVFAHLTTFDPYEAERG